MYCEAYVSIYFDWEYDFFANLRIYLNIINTCS